MYHTIDFNNTTIRFKDEGKGPGIVLLHGYLESLEIWSEFSTELAEHCRVVSIDLPGHGKSGVIGKVHTMELLAQTVKSVMDFLDTGKYFMIGHSLGGYVALAFLELFPDCLSGLSLFHSHSLADSNEAIENRKREIKIVENGKKDLIYAVNIPKAFATDNLEKFSEQVDYAKKIARDIPGDGIVAVLNGMINRPDRSNILTGTSLPFLWILGRKDNYIPYEAIIKKVELPKHGKLITLENSGHMGFMEEKQKSLEAIIGLLVH
ncbi:MAG: alpha/beta hydrolase [Bacteroidales bacterium]|nr:alpha/beta hydrolase [Bacteroidales bacterium]